MTESFSLETKRVSGKGWWGAFFLTDRVSRLPPLTTHETLSVFNLSAVSVINKPAGKTLFLKKRGSFQKTGAPLYPRGFTNALVSFHFQSNYHSSWFSWSYSLTITWTKRKKMVLGEKEGEKKKGGNRKDILRNNRKFENVSLLHREKKIN